MLTLAYRMARSTEPRLLWKFAYNFGWKGMLSVQRFKKRLKQGVVFPPFIYMSITSRCNLRCQGCWVDVRQPENQLTFEEMDKVVSSAKAKGNVFFGILGGEPFMHPDLMRLLAKHPDCYFQIFTNGHYITDEVAAELRRIGNATPLVSVEGTSEVSDARRGGTAVLSKTMQGLETCLRHKLITGVAASVCQTNIDTVLTESWVDDLVGLGAHYIWYHTYRVVGPNASPELALRPDQVRAVRRFAVEMRNTKPVIFVDAYWNDKGEALCPAATGISHHIGPGGDVEPCPIIQFATETVNDHDGDIYETLTKSALLEDFRKTAAKATRGCVVLERPDLLKEVVTRHACRDTTVRQTAMSELESLDSRPSQHDPGNEIPEKHWVYRFAKKHWFFGFGAYT